MKNLLLGIVRETKDPPDKRVPLTPAHCRELLDLYPGLKIIVQPSDYRCFADSEYSSMGITLGEDLSGCDALLGVKEVDPGSLLRGKSYFFFSHTAKKQPYNRDLLKSVVDKNIRLIDYEYLTDEARTRVVAFGRWAGVVGAYNGLRGFGLRYRTFELTPASRCKDLAELVSGLQNVDMGSVRIAVTGGGRVAGGATEILNKAGIMEVAPEEYLELEFESPVYTRLDPWHYARRSDGSKFDFGHFMAHPGLYENAFTPYAAKTDMYIACHFWDPLSPVLFTREELADGTLPIRVVADVSCDINGPVPSTIRASTIAEPFYGYDPVTGTEADPFDDKCITVMAVDNLPGELPRDASSDFGAAIKEHVIPELLELKMTGMLERATIAQNGSLTSDYKYLEDYLEGRE